MNDLTQKVREWVEKQGYPLEMRVAKIFGEAGFRVIPSEFYFDKATETEREIDVVASTDHRVGQCLARVEFVIECKSSLDKPWILFSHPAAPLAPPARVRQRASSEAAQHALRSICKSDKAHGNALFEFVGPAAFNVTQAFTTGKDVPYEAMTSVASAALAIAKEYDAPEKARFDTAKFTFPLIVVDGKMVSCTLSDDGKEVDVSEVDCGTVIWRSQRVGAPHTIIPILREDRVSDYALQMRLAAKEFLVAFESEIAAGHQYAVAQAAAKLRALL